MIKHLGSFSLVACWLLVWAGNSARAAPVQPKVVILGYFETSHAYGIPGFWGEAEKPGELFYWIEGLKLNHRLPVAGAFNDVWSNEDGSIIA